MKKRLSKIARDLNANISDIVAFLCSEGYDATEDPRESYPESVVETIENNFPAFISDRRKSLRAPDLRPSEHLLDTTKDQNIPLELKIIAAANHEKKLIERIIGFTTFNWHFNMVTYQGECSQPVDFSLFDEVLCGLLLIEQMSAARIGEILGLDIQKDPAERAILFKAIDSLKNDKMLEGDESIMWLTDTGRDYAHNGVKFSTFKRKFDLYFDSTGNAQGDIKGTLSKLNSEKIRYAPPIIDVELDKLRALAEFQAPEVHFPEKQYILQSAQFVSVESFKAPVWVILLENFRDNTMRSLIYDEKQNSIIEPLSSALDQKEQIKTQLLEALVALDDDIEYTEEEKREEQLSTESALIQKQSEIEEALESEDVEKIAGIKKELETIKRHFDSIEFEIELKRLFDETTDELWIISPWIKNATFKRIPFFEQYLKKGGKIFITYSEPESPGQEMAYEAPLNKLLALEKKYQSFYIHQLAPFHYKNVWLRKNSQGHSYYTGSYNILSFFVKQGLQKVRQEKMTRLDWNTDNQGEYEEVLEQFALKYIYQARETFNLFCKEIPEVIDKTHLQKLKSLEYSKLKPFIDQGITKFDKAHKELKEAKQHKINQYRKRFFETKIQEFKKQAETLSEKTISREKKKTLQHEFETLRDEFMDFMDLQISSAMEVTQMLDDLRVFNTASQRRRKTKKR